MNNEPRYTILNEGDVVAETDETLTILTNHLCWTSVPFSWIGKRHDGESLCRRLLSREELLLLAEYAASHNTSRKRATGPEAREIHGPSA